MDILVSKWQLVCNREKRESYGNDTFPERVNMVMNYYERALQLREETVAHRRWLHTNAEAGLDMPKAQAYVLQTLKEYGLEPEPCGYGVMATLGEGDKCILLRADMDALPMAEESGLEFASVSGAAHTCGHDFHAAMLLTAAKMLKENETSLKGTVKFMFQTAEETFEGAKNMIENGILENPKVDAALAFHVTSGQMPIGIYVYNADGTMMASVDGFRIDIQGKGSHGAYPQNAIDPINVGVHIHLALQALIAREADPSKMCVMTVGKFQAGSAANIIPESAVLEGTIRTNDRTQRELLVRRMQETAAATAAVFGASATVTMTSGVAPLLCNKQLTQELTGYLAEMGVPGAMPYPGITASASEDFATIAEAVPGTFIYLSAGYLDARGTYPAHNPKVQFNEDVCPIGAAGYAHCAQKWLENHG